jgi:hypothetical protein
VPPTARRGEPDPDGFKRIAVGRYGAQQTVIVGHVDLSTEAA